MDEFNVIDYAVAGCMAMIAVLAIFPIHSAVCVLVVFMLGRSSRRPKC